MVCISYVLNREQFVRATVDLKRAGFKIQGTENYESFDPWGKRAHYRGNMAILHVDKNNWSTGWDFYPCKSVPDPIEVGEFEDFWKDIASVDFMIEELKK